MLITLWSPNGGAGTSVFAAATALVIARTQPVRLADLDGDQPGILALPNDPAVGLGDWLAAGPGAPADALDRLAVNVAPNLTLLPCGTASPADAAPEAGAALAVVLGADPTAPTDSAVTIVDAGCADAPARRALIEVSDLSIVVVRDCYLALRRALRTDLVAAAAGAVAMDDEYRALGPREVADVLPVPVLATVPMIRLIYRSVDAGLLATRMPAPLQRAATRFVDRLGIAGAGRREDRKAAQSWRPRSRRLGAA